LGFLCFGCHAVWRMRTGISITITRSVRGRLEAITRDLTPRRNRLAGGDHPLERRRCWHQRDHAPDRQVEDLRLALAGTVIDGLVDLQVAINRFLAKTNADPKPFTWTADPDKIIAAFSRGHQALDSIH
jgi:hypothetical protein